MSAGTILAVAILAILVVVIFVGLPPGRPRGSRDRALESGEEIQAENTAGALSAVWSNYHKEENEMPTEMPTATQVINDDIATGMRKIEDAADWLRRIAQDCESRFEAARDAGRKLAGEIYRFIEDPEGVGTDALREAYQAFMALDSANFYVPGAVS